MTTYADITRAESESLTRLHAAICEAVAIGIDTSDAELLEAAWSANQAFKAHRPRLALAILQTQPGYAGYRTAYWSGQ